MLYVLDFQIYVGVLVINTCFWFSHVLNMNLDVLMVVWTFGCMGIVNWYLILVLETLCPQCI